MAVNGETCVFHNGGSTISSYCEAGCCDEACCGESEISATTVAIMVCSTVGGLLILFLLALAFCCIMRKRGWCQWWGDDERGKKKKKKKPKKVVPKTDFKKTQKKKNENLEDPKKFVINGKWDWHGWKKTTYGEDTKATQTGDYKQKPGDTVLPSKSRWFPVKKDKNAIKDPRTNIKEIGVGTDQIENYRPPVRKDKVKAVAKAVKAFQTTGTGSDNVRSEPQLKEVRPISDNGGDHDNRVASPSQVTPYEATPRRPEFEKREFEKANVNPVNPYVSAAKGRGGVKHDSDDGYKSGNNKSETPNSLQVYGRQDTDEDSLRQFNRDVHAEARDRGADAASPLSDPNREARDRNRTYAPTWHFPEVKKWAPAGKNEKGDSKWSKAHEYAKNINPK